MPITITITDPTPEQIAALFDPEAQRAIVNQRVNAADDAAREAMQAARKTSPRKPKAENTTAMSAETVTQDPEDAQLAAEIAADVAAAPAEPEGAKMVVDAGTGKPMGEPISPETLARAGGAPAEDDGEVLELTFDEVKKKATLLAAKDMQQLAGILQKYGAGKLSEVPEDKLGDFAADVLAALG